MSVEESEPPQYIVTGPGDERYDDDDDKSSTTTTTSTATAQSTGTAINVKTTKTHNTRSQSLQSSSTTVAATDQTSTLSASLMQQLKAQSTMNIVTQKITSTQMTTTTSSSSSSASVGTGTKSKFTSFLQHPDTSVASHGATFLTAQQKHVRQFVRSTSAHSSTESSAVGSITGKSDKCIRSTSQQIDDDPQFFTTDYGKGLHQSAAILISKSAETIEGFQRSTSTASTTTRPHLTLSGGFLAPPNRKLTILSPIHAPPGLQELLKKHRSPLSPRISFPGPETDLFP